MAKFSSFLATITTISRCLNTMYRCCRLPSFHYIVFASTWRSHRDSGDCNRYRLNHAITRSEWWPSQGSLSGRERAVDFSKCHGSWPSSLIAATEAAKNMALTVFLQLIRFCHNCNQWDKHIWPTLISCGQYSTTLTASDCFTVLYSMLISETVPYVTLAYWLFNVKIVMYQK